MTSHTPGPWRFDTTWALVYGPKQEEIAAIHAVQDPRIPQRRREDAQANARLIVAAPALLEALERLARIVATNAYLPTRAGWTGEEARAIEQARRAIAQAKGDERTIPQGKGEK